MQSKVPLPGCWGDPSEIGPVVVFLASEASSYMTGDFALRRQGIYGPVSHEGTRIKTNTPGTEQ